MSFFKAADGPTEDINEWSLLTGQLLRRFAGHQGSVLSIVMLDQRLDGDLRWGHDGHGQ